MNVGRTRGFIGAALVTISFGIAGCSQPSEDFTIERKSVNGLPSVMASQNTTGEAKVEAIDYDDRSIALEGPDGKSEIFKVRPEVRNFEQIKKGDVVKVQYMQTVNVNVRKVGAPLATTEVLGVATAPLGDKPAVVAVRTVETLANVQAIDYQARTVTLVGMNAKPFTFIVDKKVTSFDQVAKGDQVIFTYTEQVSIDVVK